MSLPQMDTTGEIDEIQKILAREEEKTIENQHGFLKINVQEERKNRRIKSEWIPKSDISTSTLKANTLYNKPSRKSKFEYIAHKIFILSYNTYVLSNTCKIIFLLSDSNIYIIIIQPVSCNFYLLRSIISSA